VKLLDFSSYLFPGKLGLVGFNDVGRVWTKGEQSNSWHDGYGGGIYLVPADLVIFQALIGHSKEGTYPYISFGVEF
jgi:outer membrane translocation and assembly module TamA